MQSQDDRDVEGLAARRERDSVVKEHQHDEVTGRYEGEELEAQRAARPEVERIGRLEKKHDELKSDVKDVRADVKELSSSVSGLRSEVAGAVGKLDGQSSVLSEMLGIVKKTAENSLDRDHVSFTARVEVDKAHELAHVAVDREQQLSAIEVTKEEKVDLVKAQRDRRKRNLKILSLIGSGIAGGAGFIELLHQIGWL